MGFKTTLCILLVLYASGISDAGIFHGIPDASIFDKANDDEYLETECLLDYWLSRPVLGIDLGTSYSRVGLYTTESVYEKGKVDIIANDQGNRTTPSWVSFTATGPLVGEAAKHQASLNPEHTIFDVKRLIGRKFDDPEVQEVIKMLPYKVLNKDGKPYIEVKVRDGETKFFSPEEISAMILQKMKLIAESYLGRDIKNAVITVPAYFNDAQRLATKIAGAITGFDMACVINEPTALAYNELKDQYNDALNPDDTAVIGAAIVGWSINLFGGSIQKSGLSLGIETAGGVMRKLILKFTTIPTKRTQVFSTYQDNETKVSIKVYEGERALTRDCLEFGRFELSGILAAPRGVPQIEVTFLIDVDRKLHVTAQDKATSKSISTTFSKKMLWPRTWGQETEKLREAVVFAVEDRNVREKIKERNKVEAFNMTNAITDGSTSREANEWLDCNQDADMDHLEEKDEELENVCTPNPIVKKADLAESSYREDSEG